MESITVFPDTNIFFHCRSVREIRWEEIFPEKTVELVVCLQVIDELDRHKRDSRLKDRAGAALKEIQLLSTAGAIIRDRVTLHVLTSKLGTASGSPLQLQADQDLRLLAQVLDYQHENSAKEIVVLTQDYGMTLRCSAWGINWQSLEEVWERPLVEEPAKKELKKREAELEKLKNRMPDLQLVMNPEGSYAFPIEDLKLEIPGDRRHRDVEEELSRLLESAPLDPLQERNRVHFDDPSLEHRTRFLLDSHSVNDNWLAYIITYQLFLEEYNEWAKLRLRCLLFDLWLVNLGGARANRIRIDPAFPIELEWADSLDGEFGRRIIEPVPPPPFSSASAGAVSTPVESKAIVSNETHYTNRHVTVWRPGDGCGDPLEFSIMVESVPHGEERGLWLGTFAVAFFSRDEAKPFQTTYTIHADELAQPKKGVIPFKFTIEQVS
jgi:hypothetical protein